MRISCQDMQVNWIWGGAASLLPQTPPPYGSDTRRRDASRVRDQRIRGIAASLRARSLLPRIRSPLWSSVPVVPLLEDALELELAAHGCVRLRHLEAGHGVVVDVAVGVKAPFAVDAIEVLGERDGLAHGLALLGGVLGLLDGPSPARAGIGGDPGPCRRAAGRGRG